MSVRRGGFAPELADEEVITMESCGEYFKLACDTDMLAYFSTLVNRLWPLPRVLLAPDP